MGFTDWFKKSDDKQRAVGITGDAKQSPITTGDNNNVGSSFTQINSGNNSNIAITIQSATPSDKEKDADKGWDEVKRHQAEKDYREKLAKLYGITQIFDNSESTPLEGIFTDLYILDKPLALRRYSLDDLQASDQKLRGHEMQRCEGIEVVKRPKSHRLFILGKPGAGKTTFLKYITLQAVKGELPQTPIFVGLREWSESNKTLMEFIVEQFAICNFPKAESFITYLLETGKAILLFDGLDEVNNEHHNKVTSEVKKLCRQYDKTQCLITCRVASVDYSFEAFKYMEVADFTDAQIETFVKKWFMNEPIKCEKFLSEFQQEQYRGLRELVSSPLLLGMLCCFFYYREKLSTNLADIYEGVFDALLYRWDEKYKFISRDVIYHKTHDWKKSLFITIAYDTFKANQYLIKEDDLVNYIELYLKKLPNIEKQEIDGEVILKAIEAQHGIFVERAQKVHSFAHLTFQEYFAACAIKGNVSYQKELMQHITDPRYREVFLLTASLLDDADNFFDLFRNAIDDLIRDDEKIVRFFQWIENKANSLNSQYKTVEVRFFYIILELLSAYNPFMDNKKIFNFLEILNKKHFDDVLYKLDAVLYNIDILPNELNPLHADMYNYGFESKSEDINRDFTMNKLLKEFFYSGWKRNNEWLEEEIENFNQLGFDSVADVLKQIIPQSQYSTADDWKLLVRDTLTKYSETENNIVGKPWSFTDEQTQLLSNYFDANKLLLDCLKLATISDREAIKNSLFLPPNQ